MTCREQCAKSSISIMAYLELGPRETKAYVDLSTPISVLTRDNQLVDLTRYFPSNDQRQAQDCCSWNGSPSHHHSFAGNFPIM